MLKQLAVACVALAFATQAASQSIIEKAKQQREAQQKQQKQQQQKAGAGQSAASDAGKNPIYKKRRDHCNRQADAQKLGGDARKRHFDQCMEGKS
jgi:hypothetical protein